MQVFLHGWTPGVAYELGMFVLDCCCCVMFEDVATSAVCLPLPGAVGSAPFPPASICCGFSESELKKPDSGSCEF